jgi:copper homeostasis protein
MLLEACLDTLDLAVKAEAAGAGRIELCDRLDVGGTTPSRELVTSVIGAVSIPVFPIIRPRGGDFFHSAAEIDSMKRDVEMVAKAGAAGIVLGVLHADRTVDAEQTRSVMDVAPQLPATFHMAFDKTPNQQDALAVIIDMGVIRVLTSGGAGKALDGVEQLRRLVVQSAGRVYILAGGSIRAHNAEEIVRRSGVREVHSRGTEVAAILAAAKRGE